MSAISGRAASAEAPASSGFAITPDNDAALSRPTRALYVGGSGAVSLVLASGDEITLSGVPGGSLLPLRVIRVRATGTTATALVGLL